MKIGCQLLGNVEMHGKNDRHVPKSNVREEKGMHVAHEPTDKAICTYLVKG